MSENMFYQFAICQKKVFLGLCNISEKSVTPIYAIVRKVSCHFMQYVTKSLLLVYAVCQKSFFFISLPYAIMNMSEKKCSIS